ncbi:MAG: hypothetical protein L0228_22190 [Planctomycetes bacterium]|nr:hypothetical protein [Planctomycetota bacterium]
MSTTVEKLSSAQVRERIESCERELRQLRRVLRATVALERADTERQQRTAKAVAHG